MNILVIDDDQIVTMSLKMILEADEDITVVDTGNNGNDAIDLYQQHQPDLLLMDIRMQPVNGIEAAKAIIEKYPAAKILFLTTFLDDEYIIEALKLGAKGYIIKQDYDTIVPALKAVYSGQSVFGTDIVSKIPNLMSTTSNYAYEENDINEKEMQIIKLVADGLSNKEIADQLFLSEGTIRNYLSGILDKLELRDRTQLAIFYYKHL